MSLVVERPEFALIDWIRNHVVDRDSVKLGIGDDAAILLPSADRELLVTTDMLMEGTDFEFPPATPQLAGRKSLAVNLSDIAAMGGRPVAAFVSVALPINRGSGFAREVYQGILKLADEYNVVVAGGDTNSWHGPLVVNVTLVGEACDKPVTRSRALAGDWIFVTGSLGGSLSGRHLTFVPRIREGMELNRLVELHAMIDISDGLAADLHHVLKQSRVGAILDADHIPIHPAARQCNDGRSPLEHALSDGEDFELLFAVSPDHGIRLTAEWNGPTPLTRIGEITQASGCWLRSGCSDLQALPPLGWSHPLAD